jgi:hypothetical protein
MPDLFISYSRADRAFVEQLDKALSARDKDAWTDLGDIHPSAEWKQEILHAIESASAVLLILSPQFVKSKACANETAHALEHNKRVIPIVIEHFDQSALPKPVRARQWVFCRGPEDFKEAVSSVVSAIDTDLDWVKSHTRLWSSRKTLLAGGPLSDADLTPDAVLVYLNKRVLRQLGWFNDSKDRLEYIARRRKTVLKCLYLLTALLAAVKFAFFITGNGLHHYLLPFLLIVAGISAAMTAHYINQNSRSLIHRYNTQLRFIAGWLTAFNEAWKFDRLASLTLDATAKNDIRGRIFVFEDLMIDELIDWIHITGHDAIELAP